MTTMQIQKIILAICTPIVIIVGIDFLVYCLKYAPKSSTLSKTFWKVGFISAIIIIYILTL